MDDSAESLTEVRDGIRSMQFVGGRCVALTSAGGRKICAIYEMRPDACRWLVRGSGVCLEIIRASAG